MEEVERITKVDRRYTFTGITTVDAGPKSYGENCGISWGSMRGCMISDGHWPRISISSAGMNTWSSGALTMCKLASPRST